MSSVGIIDIGFGNLRSLECALKECEFTSERIVRCSKKKYDLLILPGVGHYGNFLKKLKEKELDKYIRETHASGGNILGICLGMQIMGRRSAEDENKQRGLELIDFDVASLESQGWKAYIPNIGFWDTQIMDRGLTTIYGEKHPFYYVHSFCIDNKGIDQENVIAYIEKEAVKYPMAVRKAKTIGVQFHPEKSHRSGIKIFKYCMDQ